MLKVTWAQAAAWRAGRHHLARRAPAGRMLAVASRLCGLHAQVLSSAELSLWARVEGLPREAVARALWEERTLVKTWAMRGTLHLLGAAELPLWRAALARSPRYVKPVQWKRAFGITMSDLDRLTLAIAAALEGRLLTREELMAEIARSGPASLAAKIGESSWGTILKPAAFSGGLCFAPSVGQRVRFTHPRTWLNGSADQEVRPTEADSEITRRYLAAYGPADYHDLARWWGGGGVTAARRWIAALGEEAAPVEVEGTSAWILAKHVRELRDTPPLRSARLLPAFDQYVVGASRHAERLMPEGCRPRVFRPQGWLSPVLAVNGRMAGVWRHEIRGSRVEVSIEPFGPVPQWARRAAAEEAERLAAFLGAAPSLSWR
jgi:hypothetical protein